MVQTTGLPANCPFYFGVTVAMDIGPPRSNGIVVPFASVVPQKQSFAAFDHQGFQPGQIPLLRKGMPNIGTINVLKLTKGHAPSGTPPAVHCQERPVSVRRNCPKGPIPLSI